MAPEKRGGLWDALLECNHAVSVALEDVRGRAGQVYCYQCSEIAEKALEYVAVPPTP